MIGDVILFHLAPEEFNLVGRAPVLNWVTYHAQTGGYDVRVALDQRSALRTDGRRKHYRFQVQGPHAMDVIARALGRPAAGVEVLQPDHGAASAASPCERSATAWPGSRDGSCSARGMTTTRCTRRSSTPARSSGCGWSADGLTPRTHSSPAGFPRRCPRSTPATSFGPTGSGCRRTATKARHRSAAASSRPNIEDYYFTPWDLGYGTSSSSTTTSSAAKRSSGWPAASHRHKVTLALDDEDVADTIATMFRKTDRAKFIDWPSRGVLDASVRQGDGER